MYICNVAGFEVRSYVFIKLHKQIPNHQSRFWGRLLEWLGKTGPVNVDVFCFCFFSKQGLQRSQASVSLTPLLEDLPKILCDKCFHWFGINHPLPVSFSCQQIVAEAKVSIFTIVFIFLLATPGFMMIVCLPDCYSRSHGPAAEITLVN